MNLILNDFIYSSNIVKITSNNYNIRLNIFNKYMMKINYKITIFFPRIMRMTLFYILQIFLMSDLKKGSIILISASMFNMS